MSSTFAFIIGDHATATAQTRHGTFRYRGPSGAPYRAWLRRTRLVARAEHFRETQRRVLARFGVRC